jgi:PKD repeat protein
MNKKLILLWLGVLFSGGLSELKAQWGYSADSLVLINGSEFGGGYVPYIFCTDGNNGVITAYVDGSNIIAQRVDSNGYLKWGAAGVMVYDTGGTVLNPKITEDGNGGCYIAWTYYHAENSVAVYNYFAQRLDANGNALWQANGKQVVFPNSNANFSANDLDILYDGSGFFMGLQVDITGGYGAVRAAKIDSTGAPVWDSAGVAVSPVQDYRNPKLISDGSDGFEMIYFQDVANPGNILMQRLDGNGNLKWGANAVGLNTLFAVTDGIYNLSHTTNTDVVATWDGYDFNAGIYAQKIDTNGNFIWGTQEVKVCDTPGEQTYPDVLSDNTGGAYFAWTDSRIIDKPARIYAQRLNANGTEQWQHNGIELDTMNTYNPNPSLAPDVDGGVRVFWPSSQGNYHTLMQRIDSSGNIICNDSGVRVSPYNSTTDLYGNRSVLHRNNGGDIVLGYYNYGLYAQYVPPGCSFPAPYSACDSLHVNFGFSNVGYSFAFTDSSVANSGTIQSRHWSFDDTDSGSDDSSALQNPRHNFPGPGTYNVCLTVTGGTNNSFCTQTACKTITINSYNACDSLFIYYTYADQGGVYVFNDSSYVLSGNVISHSWNFGDSASGENNTSSLQSPQHTFTAPGNYYVCEYVTGGENGNNCLDSLCTTVTVLPSGIEDVSDINIYIYPNPVYDVLHIARNTRLARIEVYNMLGEMVLKEEGDVKQVAVASLAQGIYSMRLQTTAGKTFVERFCK